ncbi:MAG TPA: isochorismatase family cysteine hydrolase [Gaiellaceae bacterium]|nr:isochorismatase family cysteine hydrolase [Gaiellaceae bacterium]
MTDALLLVDVLKDFRHKDGDALVESYRRKHPALVALLAEARFAGMPVVYANDHGEHSRPEDVVREAIEEGLAGELVAEVVPADGERVFLKDAYSAFDGTDVGAFLDELGVDRVVVAGAALEHCAFQTALDAAGAGLDVIVRGDASASVDDEHERIALDYLERVLGLEVVRASE